MSLLVCGSVYLLGAVTCIGVIKSGEGEALRVLCVVINAPAILRAARGARGGDPHRRNCTGVIANGGRPVSSFLQTRCPSEQHGTRCPRLAQAAAPGCARQGL